LIFNYILTLIIILLSVAFFTLFEVRTLGVIHLRPGPDRVSIAGILQPLGDFVKLFSKGSFDLRRNLNWFYFMSPLLGVFLRFILWRIYFSYFSYFSFFWGVLLFFCLSSFSVYFLLFRG
jgi:NADH:ubiquinone oxidoreductase subunit H